MRQRDPFWNEYSVHRLRRRRNRSRRDSTAIHRSFTSELIGAAKNIDSWTMRRFKKYGNHRRAPSSA